MSTYKGYTQQQGKRSQKYQSENLEQVRVWVKKGEKTKYMAYAESQGKSLTRLIVDLLEKELEKSCYAHTD